jgi:hypothetical protein
LSDALVLIAVLALAAVVLVPPVPAGAVAPVAVTGSCTGTTTVTCTYSSAGTTYSFTVPAGVTSVTIVANGGGGGGSGGAGGSGTKVTATRTVTGGQVISVFVGGGGTGSGSGSGGGGGGATRVDSTFIVAGGGGGGGSRSGGGAGGSLAGGGNGSAGSIGTVGTSAGGGGVLGSGGSGGAGGSGSNPCAGFGAGTCVGGAGTGTTGGAGGGDDTNAAGGAGGGGVGGFGGVYQPFPPEVLTGAGGGGGGGGHGGGGGGGGGSVVDGSASGGGGGVGGSTGPAGSTYGSAGNGGGANSSGGSGSATITYTKAAQTITFGALGAKTFGDADFDLTATSTSGGAVGFKTNTTDVCTVTAGGTVSIEGAGDCTIDADQDGTDGYTAAPRVSRTFGVAKASQSITFGALGGKTFGDVNFDLTAAATSRRAVTFASATTDTCTVTDGTVSIVAAGDCTIDADQPGDDDWDAASTVSRTFTVAKADQIIDFAALGGLAVGVGDFDVSAAATSTLGVAFSTATTTVCTLAGATVSIAGVGTCTIDADQAGDDDWNAASTVSRSFTVARGDQTIDFGAPPDAVFGGADFVTSATASSGLTVVLSSATPAACAVAGFTVSILGAGTCTIDADQGGDGDWNSAPRVSRGFAVAKGDQTIAFGALADAVFGDAPHPITAAAGSGLAVTFTTPTPAVCTVGGGTVTILAAGTCEIAADQGGDGDWNPAPRVVRDLVVAKAGQTITFDAPRDRTFGDEPFQLSATASSGGAMTFSSASRRVCSVAAQTVTILAAGTCTITARQAGDADHLVAPSVPQEFTVDKADQTISFDAPADRTFGDFPFPLSASASSGLPPALSSETPAVCALSGSIVTIVGAGTCTIDADQGGDGDWNSAPRVSRGFAVAKGDQTIAFGALADAVFGDAPRPITAAAGSGLAVAFTTPTPAVCTVGGGTVTILAAGTCEIAADQGGDGDWNPAPRVVRDLVVAKAGQTISFDAPRDRTFGDEPFQLSATASSGFPVILSSATPAVCTLAGSTVTIVGAGSCVVVAEQPGDSGFAAADPRSLQVEISQAQVSITIGAIAGVAAGDPSFEVLASASSGLPVTLSSQTPDVCTVDGTTVTVVSAGTCTVVAVHVGDANHAFAEADVTFEVEAGLPDPPEALPHREAEGSPGSGIGPWTIVLLLLAATGTGAWFVIRLRRSG